MQKASHNVLVLNRLWQAVNICSVERAWVLLYTHHAQVVYEEDGVFNAFSFPEWCDFSSGHDDADCFHTITMRIRIPRVIVLLVFDRFPRNEVKFTRNNVFERDKNTCQYCGRARDRKELNIDHVVPRRRGGRTVWKNVVCSCVPCNCRKGSRTPGEAGMRLIRPPRKPKWRPFVQVQVSHAADHPWRHFIDMAYWNVELGDNA